MGDLAATLAATGAEVIAVDFPGHGRAAGRVLHMGLAVKAIAAAERRFGAFDAAIGHSFGGAALMVAAAGMLPGVAAVLPEKLALIGSPSEMHWLFKDFGRMIGLDGRRNRCLRPRCSGSPAGDWRNSTRAGRPTRSGARC